MMRQARQMQKQVKNTYDPMMGTAAVTGRVAVLKLNMDMLNEMIPFYAPEGTPEAYMKAIISTEGYRFFKNPNPPEEPVEGNQRRGEGGTAYR